MTRPRPITPGAGQESVWDYPRPPRLETTSLRIEVELGGVTVADTTHALRVLETSHPPTYYIPLGDVAQDALRPSSRTSFCEWKGRAAYLTVSAGGVSVRNACWTYPEPTPRFQALIDHVAFYCGPMDACRVDGFAAQPQPGGFYGGWVTPHVVGPFKGVPGSLGW